VHGVRSSELAAKFIDLWMHSPGHRENMLRASFGYLGVGVVAREGMFYATQVFGDLAARLEKAVARNYRYGSEHVFSFKFLGKFPKSKISVFVRFPDSSARFHLTENRFYTGMGVYKPEWHGDTFRVRIKFDKGHGVYTLHVGSYGVYYAGGVALRVE